jgi:hypothetical protein
MNENGDLADSHNIFKIWNSYVSALLDVYMVSDVRQIEIHTYTSIQTLPIVTPPQILHRVF